MRHLRVAAVAALLAAATAGLAWASAPVISTPLLPVHIPWWGLALGYLGAGMLPVEYEVNGRLRWFTFSEFALAIGLVFLAPGPHIGVRVLGGVVEFALIRRQAPVKVIVNTGLAALEVAVATAVATALATVVGHPTGPGPLLWGTLAGALLVADVVPFLVMHLVLVFLGAAPWSVDLRNALRESVVSTGLFSGVAIVAVAAVWSDVWTALVGAAVALTLALGYRKHVRLSGEQLQTAELHQFLKGLGPFDLDAPGRDDLLERVRNLLRVRHLALAVRSDLGWVHYRVGDEDVAPQQTEWADGPDLPGAHLYDNDHMSAPLLGAQDLVGVLRVRSREGASKAFTLRDRRLLETLASELAKAIERGRLQRQLATAATTDALTQLPNLPETARLLQELLDGEPEGVLVATFAVDSFREVNDTLGHQVGDDLLREVTRRVKLSYPDALTGRIGGGRFAVALSAHSLGGDPAMFGLSLRAQIEGGAQLGPVGTHIKLSVGCVHGPEHGREATTLIRRAETAMYSARHAGGGPVIWEPAYEVEGHRRLAVVMALREALASGAIGVGFQPKVDALTRTVTGVEALARWTHPALGAISPLEFVPLAEAAGLMGPLTTTVMRQALTACKGWQRRGGRIGIAVNVSAETILDLSFVTEVAAVLTSVNVAPDLLTLELTEGVVVNDPHLAAQRLGELRSLGVKISVDDFGTGYSALTYLKGLPVDEVKVDKGFVDGIVHDGADRAVVRAIVDIAHTLGLRVVAEGVEQEEQHHLLARLGVDEVQGYLHARPMAALDMAQWLRRRDQDATVS